MKREIFSFIDRKLEYSVEFLRLRGSDRFADRLADRFGTALKKGTHKQMNAWSFFSKHLTTLST